VDRAKEASNAMGWGRSFLKGVQGGTWARGHYCGYNEGMRVIIDLDLCEANALCVTEAPEIFHLDEDDQLHLLQEHPEELLRDKAVAAVRACPKAALTIID